MAVAKKCSICEKSFSNKSNMNRHFASAHQKKDKKKDMKNAIEGADLKKISNHELRIQTLNRVLWNIVLHLIRNKRLTTGQSSMRKLTSS